MGLRVEPVESHWAFNIEVKRLSLPFKLHSDCPECGYPCEIDLAGAYDYLSYPNLGVPELADFRCHCGARWDEHFVLRIEIDPVADPS
jgi:hypothetical protein